MSALGCSQPEASKTRLGQAWAAEADTTDAAAEDTVEFPAFVRKISDLTDLDEPAPQVRRQGASTSPARQAAGGTPAPPPAQQPALPASLAAAAAGAVEAVEAEREPRRSQVMLPFTASTPSLTAPAASPPGSRPARAGQAAPSPHHAGVVTKSFNIRRPTYVFQPSPRSGAAAGSPTAAGRQRGCQGQVVAAPGLPHTLAAHASVMHTSVSPTRTSAAARPSGGAAPGRPAPPVSLPFAAPAGTSTGGAPGVEAVQRSPLARRPARLSDGHGIMVRPPGHASPQAPSQPPQPSSPSAPPPGAVPYQSPTSAYRNMTFPLAAATDSLSRSRARLSGTSPRTGLYSHATVDALSRSTPLLGAVLRAHSPPAATSGSLAARGRMSSGGRVPGAHAAWPHVRTTTVLTAAAATSPPPRLSQGRRSIAGPASMQPNVPALGRRSGAGLVGAVQQEVVHSRRTFASPGTSFRM